MSKNWELKPGDIVTAYGVGIFEVIEVLPRWNSKRGWNKYEHEENENSLNRIGDLITHRKLYDGQLKPIKAKTLNQCDSTFCTKISNIAVEQIKDLERRIEFYKQFIIKDE